MKYSKLFTAFCGLMILCSCKPSVDNYKAAYDLAVQRQHEGLTDELYDKMYQESLPRLQDVNGDSVRVKSLRLVRQYIPSAADSAIVVSSPQDYNVAVAKYKMLTNARAHADRLANGKFKLSHVLRTVDSDYYVIIYPATTLQEAAQVVKKFKDSGEKTIGIPEPYILRPIR